MIDKSKFKNKKEWRKFGIALAAFLFLLAAVLYIRHSEAYLYLSGAGVFISLSALVFPWLIKPLFIFFSYFGYVMGWIVRMLDIPAWSKRHRSGQHTKVDVLQKST